MQANRANWQLDGRCVRRILDDCSLLGQLIAPLPDEPQARLESEVGGELARLLLAGLAGDHRARRDAFAPA